MKKRKMLYMKTILKEQIIFGTNILQGKKKKVNRTFIWKGKNWTPKTNPIKNKIKKI